MKKFIIAILALLIALVLLSPQARQFKQRRWIGQARAALKNQDYARAWLVGRKILELNPKNAAAWSVLAEVAGQLRSPLAIPLHQRLVLLEPGAAQRQIDLADATVRLGHRDLARTVLDSLDHQVATSASWHEAVANLALIAQDFDALELHLQRAVQQDPGNPLHAFNLAVFQLASGQAAVLKSARAVLEPFRSDPALKADALRSLLSDAIRQGQLDRAELLAVELETDWRSDFLDRLRHLELVAVRRPNELAPCLDRLQREVRHDPDGVRQLGGWMAQSGRAREALTWINTLPGRTPLDPGVMLLRAECLVLERRWPILETNLRDENWKTLDFQRLAILSLALRAQGECESAGAVWQKAVRAAAGVNTRLRTLVQCAAAWNWGFETEQLLWLIVCQLPRERWASEALLQAYHLDGQTRRLYDLCAVVARQRPGDLVALNNLATISLLIRTNLDEAHQLATEVFCKRSDLAGCASTLAYSLHLRGRTAEGLDILKCLSADQLERPATAAYYSLLLATVGQSAEAHKYAVMADRGPLLPEECAFVLRNL